MMLLFLSIVKSSIEQNPIIDRNNPFSESNVMVSLDDSKQSTSSEICLQCENPQNNQPSKTSDDEEKNEYDENNQYEIPNENIYWEILDDDKNLSNDEEDFNPSKTLKNQNTKIQFVTSENGVKDPKDNSSDKKSKIESLKKGKELLKKGFLNFIWCLSRIFY
ncbi:hypothetical protein A0H76_2728 [Hepatospora eriocheir]|uniref:Uncharacterized protein n=1 Tax=Hepatospora eriocheir TaxID=1081669 RepID=A0A1X0QF87_9MICR|nr:hypothetical protein A0H76_2728 [Hepatospora eriocheir]